MIPGVPLLAQNTAVDQPASYSISQAAQQLQLQRLVLLRSLSRFLEAAVQAAACIYADFTAVHSKKFRAVFN